MSGLVHRPIRAGYRLARIALWTLFGASLVWLCRTLRWRAGWRRALRFFWQGFVRAMGLRIIIRGEPVKTHPTLFVANHSSYLDIPVLGAQLDACFIAKQEIDGWPVIGWLTRLGGTIFVNRQKRSSSVQQRDEIGDRLTKMGESLVLFPEGTTSDGNRVLPFKSALFAVAAMPGPHDQPITVQPVSVAYTRLDHLAMGRVWRPFCTWYGDMTLGPHVWMLLGLGRPTIEVTFLPPVTLAHYGSRKALSDHCHDVISRDMILSITGRQPPLPAPAAR